MMSMMVRGGRRPLMMGGVPPHSEACGGNDEVHNGEEDNNGQVYTRKDKVETGVTGLQSDEENEKAAYEGVWCTHKRAEV